MREFMRSQESIFISKYLRFSKRRDKYIDSQAKFEFEQFHQCEIKQTTTLKNCQLLPTNSFSSLNQCPNMLSPQSPQKFFFRFAQFAAVNFHWLQLLALKVLFPV